MPSGLLNNSRFYMKKTIVCILAAAVATVNLWAQQTSADEWRAAQAQAAHQSVSAGENPLAEIKQTPGLAGIFQTWGFIGDSLSSGEHEYTRKDGRKGYDEYSWGQRMCALMGARGDNYSKGGETAKGWIDHFWDNPNNGNNNIDAKADPKQAYIMALCINDKGKGFKPGDVHTDVDTLDYNNNADTFAGYYAGIIQRVKSIQPRAKFFVVTRPNDKNTDERYNEVIRSMADIFSDVYVIDLYKYAPLYSEPEFRDLYFLGGHMSAAGYEFTAWMMMTYIDWIIRKNPKEFAQVAYIGKDYKYDPKPAAPRPAPAK